MTDQKFNNEHLPSSKKFYLTGNFSQKHRVLGKTVAKDVNHLMSKVWCKIPYDSILIFVSSVIDLSYEVSKPLSLKNVLLCIKEYCDKKEIEVPELTIKKEVTLEGKVTFEDIPAPVESYLEWYIKQKGTVLSIEKRDKEGKKFKEPQFIKIKAKVIFDLLGMFLRESKIKSLESEYQGYWRYIVSTCMSKPISNSFFLSVLRLEDITHIQVKTKFDDTTYPVSSKLTLPSIKEVVKGRELKSHLIKSVTSKGMGKKQSKVGGGKESVQLSTKISVGRTDYPVYYYPVDNLPKKPSWVKEMLGKFFFVKEGINYEVGYLVINRKDNLTFWANNALRNANTKELEIQVNQLKYQLTLNKNPERIKQLQQDIYLATWDIPYDVLFALTAIGVDIQGNAICCRSKFDWGKLTSCLVVHPYFPISNPSHVAIEKYNEYVEVYNQYVQKPEYIDNNGNRRAGWLHLPIKVINY